MKQFLKQLLKLLKESTITQTLLVIFVFGPLGYCVISGIEIPLQYTTWGGVIIGFFFGAKATYQIMKGR